MILFVYTIFRVFLLFLLNIGLESDQQVRAQDTARRIPAPVDSSEVFRSDKVIDAALDSAIRAVQELRDIHKLVKKGTAQNKRLSKKLDSIYYGSILPLKYLQGRTTTTSTTITGNITVMPAIHEVRFVNNELCIDRLPHKVTPEAAMSRVKPKFFQRIKNFFKKK